MNPPLIYHSYPIENNIIIIIIIIIIILILILILILIPLFLIKPYKSI